MDIKTCMLLAQYNQATNQKMNALIRTLSKAQWEQELGGYFKSIKLVCSHIYISDFNWLKRFRQLKDFRFSKDSLFDQELSYASSPFESMDEYVSKREELDTKLIMLAEEIVESDLDKILSFKNIKGASVSKNFGGSVLSMFIHQTHHRGMISLYLDMMKIDNDFSSLLPLV